MLESAYLKSFYHIPGYDNYVVSQAGDVYNTKHCRFLFGSVNPDGYTNVRLTANDGATLTWGLHRLLAYVFIPTERDYRSLVVNHKDGKKANNSLSNLEWVTYTENIEHAGLNELTTKCIPIIVRDIETGIEKFYPSVNDCCRELHLSKDAILWRLKFPPARVFPEARQYRKFNDDRKWEPRHVSSYGKVGKNIGVLMKNLRTGIVTYHEGQRSLAKKLKIADSTICVWLDREDQPVLPGLIQLQRDCSEPKWRDVIDPYLELEDFTSKRVVKVYRPSTEETFIYESAIECAKAHDVSPTALNYRLASSKRNVYDGLVYEYYRSIQRSATTSNLVVNSP